jgi:hypothetical protein
MSKNQNMGLHQPVAYAGQHETIQTTTTPVTSGQISKRYIIVASAGDDHLVEFGETPGASMTSALVPKGSTLTFNTESYILTDGDFVVSVRAVNGTGLVTIYHGTE